jgi:PPM family protein phosphatase
MKISIGAKTDIGGRSNNEDCLAVLDNERVPLRADAVLLIADGMGGRADGEEASAIAIKQVRETLMEFLNPSSDEPLPPAEDILAAGMRRANSAVFALSSANEDEAGMGTTLIAALISEGILTFAHVGDSRVYLIRDGEIQALTVDHTYVGEQVRAGNLTVQAARVSRFRNVITRAIGVAPTVQPDFHSFSLQDKDNVVFCTDGLTNTVDDEDILAVVLRSGSVQAAANSLVDSAKAGGARDNITVLTVRVSADVMSGRTKRLVTPEQSNGTKPDETADNEVSEKPAKNIISTPNDEEITRSQYPTSSSGFGLVMTAVLSALLGAAITAGALYEIGSLKRVASAPPATKPSVAVAGPVTDAALLTSPYSAPVAIFYKPVRSDFLLVADHDLYVASQTADVIIHVNDQGQEVGIVKSHVVGQKPDPLMQFYATDTFGNLYISNLVTGDIKQVSPKGVTRTLASGLTEPGAVAINNAGDLYFIEDGDLEVIHPIVDSGK